MRVVLTVGWVLLACGVFASASEPRAAAIVGTVTGLDAESKAELSVHRLGGTELMDGYGHELDEALVRTLETGADGRFEVAGLAPGVYVLIARQGTSRMGEAVVRVFAGSRRERSVTLAPTRWLSGSVAWSDGRPVEGTACVRMRRHQGRVGGFYDPWSHAEPMPPSGPTFEANLTNGRFRIGLTARRTDVWIETPDGFRVRWGESWDPAAEIESKTVPVPTKTVAGRVLDATGAPLSGVRIETRYHVEGEASLLTSAATDADGRFTLRVVDAPAPIRVFAAGYRRLRESAFAGGDLVLEAVPTGTLEGTVLREGAPVVGAVVHAVPGSHQGWARGARRVVSDADGRYRIVGLPVAPAAVFVRGGGFASVDLATVRSRGPNPFGVDLVAGEVATRDLPVGSAATLVGRVVDHAGEPVAGATLLALGVTAARGGAAGFDGDQAKRARVGPYAATTDDDGSFRIPDLVPGLLLSMRIDAPGRPRLLAVASPAADELTVLRFARPRFLTVRVVDGDSGTPLAGASIRFEHHAERAETGPDGRAQFGPFGDGRVQLRVRAEGYVPVIDVDVPGSEGGPGPFEVTVPLARGLTITGRVLDVDGTPLEGVHLSALHATETRAGLQARARTDAEGRFVLAGLFPGTWRIQAHHLARDPKRSPPHRQRELQVEAEAGTRDVTLRFETASPQPVVVVRVVGPDGHPVPRADAQLVVRGRRVASITVLDGQAALAVRADVLEGPAPIEAFVHVAGATDAAGTPLPLGAASRGLVKIPGSGVRLILPPERRITGQVLSPAGEPVVGAVVHAHRPLGGPRAGYAALPGSPRTDAAGRFTIRYLGPGTHVLEVDAGARFLVPQEAAEAGAEGVTIRLVRALTARVVVLGPDGQPLSGATVRLEPSEADRRARNEVHRKGERRPLRPTRYVRRTWETTVNGAVVLEQLVPGRVYDLEVGSRRDRVQDAKRADWAPAAVEIRLERGLVIAGRLVDEEGVPVRDGIVALEGGNRWSGIRCGLDGAFRFVRLPPGPYTLHAGRRGMNWEDPGVRKQVVPEGAEDLLVPISSR